ncbi:hypothetical protein F5050DRAFT_1812057 [Lentinula boryana]|uniref:Ribosome assembly protein 3 n=1 Tax=Lentinula boryana TaxID=40481 RepID=A0ABQ8PZE5_9AGAR|nr:hypothetical protein F5050DRAFT_1812057 [Lentinula boryana]
MARKRPNRKRKRRAVSISSSSSGNSSSSDNDSAVVKSVPALTDTPKTKTDEEDEDLDSNSDSDSSSSSSSSSSGDSHSAPDPSATFKSDSRSIEKSRRLRSPSPGPIAPSTLQIPSFLSEKDIQDAKESERVLQEKFTQFWMNSIVEGFKDDLEIIRKDPALTTSKLSMLVDSLSSGAEIFSPSQSHNAQDGRNVTDMDIVLG